MTFQIIYIYIYARIHLVKTQTKMPTGCFVRGGISSTTSGTVLIRRLLTRSSRRVTFQHLNLWKLSPFFYRDFER